MNAFQILLGAIAILAMFLLLVVPHEGGHFGMAKLFGIRVIEFSVGMGTKLLSFNRGGSLYALRAFPVGGFVRLGGMEPGDYEDPHGFHSKPAYQRLLVLLGGPLANFLMASLIWTTFLLLNLNDDPGKVVTVSANTPAAAAGLRSGDSIRAVDGISVKQSEDIRKAENRKAGQPLEFTVRHSDGRVQTVIIQPVYDSASPAGYKIGVSTEAVRGPGDALAEGIQFPFVMAAGLVVGLYDLLTGQIPGGFLGPQGATGAIGIAAITYEAAAKGVANYWLPLVAQVSVALGLANLLPLPALDGGRMLVVILEALKRTPFNRDRELAVQRAGLMALLALVLVIAYFDVQRLVSGQFAGH